VHIDLCGCVVHLTPAQRAEADARTGVTP
jgi:hypothetical protein